MWKFAPIKLVGLMFVVCSQLAAASMLASERGVTYVSGGVGVGEQQELIAQEKNFNLKLVFTLVEGNYLADVNVVLADAKGNKLIEHLADGPFFMAKLPAGQYTVSATYEGKTVTRKVNVSAARLHTEHFRWPRNPEVDFVVSRSTKE